MRSWVFIFLMIPYSYAIQMRETEYECGAHGRFEYCIDGVPGCVIGCHCHPGYYFDTDTKICESNIRLSQHFRRNYDMLEPTRVFVPPTPAVIEEPVTTANNPVDEKIDIITKDADDLGDWLYNQFFKTIENQVINETKDDSIITRRSESAPTFIKKPTRRSHRYWRARRKKKKKKKDLKSKLLRITEDDSLFDSSSASTSEEGSDSSSSSASSEESKESKEKKKTKKDHGHKKIVVFNKRPKPPLPSFIFLPNMETPFFPPIGLPPPPMPMYPMIPVPPMMGPFPFPVATPACQAETNQNGNGSTQPTHTDKPHPHQPTNSPDTNAPDSTDKPSNENPSADDPPGDDTPDLKPSTENPPDENPPNENAPDEKPPDEKPPDENPPNLRTGTKKRRGPRNKLMQKLRDKLKRKNKLQNYFANEYQGPPMLPPGFMINNLPNIRHKPLPEINVEDELATLQDVDFKYLSQLIHRADLNKTKHNSPTTTPPAHFINVLTAAPPSRRNYYDNYPNQIAQVLNDLANQPINPNPENQLAYDVPNENNNLSNQFTYNAPNHPIQNIPNQAYYNPPNQPTQNIPNQPFYNPPNQPTYNIPNKPYYNATKYPINNINQPTYNVPNSLSYNALNQPIYNIPKQPTYNVPNHPSYNVGNQPTYVSLNKPPHSVPYRKKIEDTNDVYYANLGRQIASMIRNIDGDKEVDIEIKSNSNIPTKPDLTGHRGSRSYWERSVRSPYKQIMTSYKNEINNLRLSNENLFSLENKVENAASTEPTLSLHELENMISKMHRVKSNFIRRNGSSHRGTQSSKSSFNVNLLPSNDQQFHSNGKVNNKAQNIQPKLSEPNSILHSVNAERQHLPSQNPPSSRSLLTDFMFTLQTSDKLSNGTTSKKNTNYTHTYVPPVFSTRKPGPVAAPQLMYKMPNPHFKSYALTVLPFPSKPGVYTNMQPYLQTTTSRIYYQQLSPMVLNHKAVNYYDGTNNNQYMYEKASIPIRPQSFPSSYIAPVSRYDTFGKRVEPSYYHHAVHHFDYFDDLL